MSIMQFAQEALLFQSQQTPLQNWFLKINNPFSKKHIPIPNKNDFP